MHERSFRSRLAAALFAGTTLSIAVAVAAGCQGEARVGSATLHATPFANAEYGVDVVSGRATLTTNSGTDTTSVIVRVEGLRPGTSHIGHIHFGDEVDPCARLQPGAIIEDLGPLTANADGTAVGRTVIDVPTEGVATCEWWIAVHEGAENRDPQTPAIAIGPVVFLEPGGDYDACRASGTLVIRRPSRLDLRARWAA